MNKDIIDSILFILVIGEEKGSSEDTQEKYLESPFSVALGVSKNLQFVVYCLEDNDMKTIDVLFKLCSSLRKIIDEKTIEKMREKAGGERFTLKLVTRVELATQLQDEYLDLVDFQNYYLEHPEELIFQTASDFLNRLISIRHRHLMNEHNITIKEKL